MNISIVWSIASKIVALGATGAMIGVGVSQITQTEPVVYHAPVIEEVSVTEEQPAELEPETPPEAPQSPQESVSKPQAPSVPSTPLEPAQKAKNDAWKRGVADELLRDPNSDHISNIDDFETIYMGWCPKDVPADAWPDTLSPLAALGYRTTVDYNARFTIETKSRQVFHLFRSGRYTAETGFVATVDDMGVVFSKTENGWFTDGRYIASHSGYQYWVNWATLTVYLDESGAYIPINDAQRAEMNRVAAQMTVRIRELDALYVAKCGQ